MTKNQNISYDPRQNRLLSALPPEEYAELLPHFELISAPVGYTLCEAGVPMHHAYFPISSIVSLLYLMEDGTLAEIAVIGNEGVVGVSIFMGGETTPNQAVVQSAGYLYRLPAEILMNCFNRAGGRRAGESLKLFLRFAQALMTQMGQTSVCNRKHSLDQKFCRRLLLSLDRLPSNEVIVTQEAIANLLGVRREGVTVAVNAIKKVGLIKCGRGRISVLDRTGLEKRVCECYAVIKNEFDRLIP